MNKKWMSGSAFLVALLAFVAVGISYLDLVFTTTTRWVFLALLLASLVPFGEFFTAFRSSYAPFLLVYLLWCLATGLWSELPLLSLGKAAAFAIVAVAFLGAGQTWVSRQQRDRPLHFLLPVVLAALFAGLVGHQAPIRLTAGNGIMVFRGLAGNPNYLGILAALALPLPLYQAYQAYVRRISPRLFAWSAVIAVLIFLLWRSGSRASILCALTILSSFALVVTTGRRTILAILFTGAVASIVVVVPEVEEGVYQRVVVKSTAGTDTFFSRRQTWQKSYDAAQQGGLVGLGYGVSAGFTDFSLGLTSNTYGREKGNAQLAVWEETGLIGLALYAILLVAVLAELFAGFNRERNSEQRMIIALAVGAVVGLLAQSVFEAWWTSPGSMESAIFWSAVGVATGLVQRSPAKVAPSGLETNKLNAAASGLL